MNSVKVSDLAASNVQQNVAHWNTLNTAIQRRDAGLCLRTIAAIVRFNPKKTLADVDRLLEKANLPLLLVANTTEKWSDALVCQDIRANTVQCPYFVQTHFVPRHHQSHALARMPLDRARPAWTRTLETNRSYLLKCGILVARTNSA